MKFNFSFNMEFRKSLKKVIYVVIIERKYSDCYHHRII